MCSLGSAICQDGDCESMDQAGEAVARFLAAMQASREQLRPLCNELTRRGAKSAPMIFDLSARPYGIREAGKLREFCGSILLGVGAVPLDNRGMEFTVDVLWDNDRWTIQTEVWIDSDKGGDLIRSFPERTATTLDECLKEIEAAIRDLCGSASRFNPDG